MMLAWPHHGRRKSSQTGAGETLVGVFIMKKLLLAATSALFVLSAGSAFAGSGNKNLALVGQAGFFNTAVVAQGGHYNHNFAGVTQLGGGNESGIQQGGSHNYNTATSFQFGFGNGSIITQN